MSNTDLALLFGPFQATDVDLVSRSEAGAAFITKHFGAGAVSATLPHSEVAKVMREARWAGLVLKSGDRT